MICDILLINLGFVGFDMKTRRVAHKRFLKWGVNPESYYLKKHFLTIYMHNIAHYNVTHKNCTSLKISMHGS